MNVMPYEDAIILIMRIFNCCYIILGYIKSMTIFKIAKQNNKININII